MDTTVGTGTLEPRLRQLFELCSYRRRVSYPHLFIFMTTSYIPDLVASPRMRKRG
jgi:hypothetical protein